MNRRSFFQAAALSTVAAVQSKGRVSLPQLPARPLQVDLADPDSRPYLRDRMIDVYVRLEELDPCDPGELSGARLIISDRGAELIVSAGIGDTLQPTTVAPKGFRTSHLLGSTKRGGVAPMLDFEPTSGDSFFITLQDAGRADYSAVRLVLFWDEDEPQLRLYLANHCLGVLSAVSLVRFFECLRMRSAITEGKPTEYGISR
ncbi:MAG: hypothetical protein P4L56_20290 [Candidatus Sulfopaludibacter sp.]|nr:hypothetical protein [Candidatus Sulfopaludibacter sp.]